MPAIVQKSASATTGIVCLGQSYNLNDDGLITVRARFLLRSVADLSYFAQDAFWPPGSSPRGLPLNQGGPYLLNRDFEYLNGLITVSATYVTAANPVRVVYGQSRATRAYSGAVGIVGANGVAQYINAKFDYVTTVASARYAIIDGQKFTPKLAGLAKINDIIGFDDQFLSSIATKEISSKEISTTGRVSQITDTLEIVFFNPF